MQYYLCVILYGPNQRGIFIHFKTIASVFYPLYPVIIDNIPSHTGVNIAAETTLQLAEEVENIIGIKESSNDLCQSMKIIKRSLRISFLYRETIIWFCRIWHSGLMVLFPLSPMPILRNIHR